MVEIKMFCISAYVKDQLMAKIRTGIKSIPMFHSNYLEELDTGDKNSFCCSCCILHMCHRSIVVNVCSMWQTSRPLDFTWSDNYWNMLKEGHKFISLLINIDWLIDWLINDLWIQNWFNEMQATCVHEGVSRFLLHWPPGQASGSYRAYMEKKTKTCSCEPMRKHWRLRPRVLKLFSMLSLLKHVKENWTV